MHVFNLEGLCHEHFSFLGQFCAEVSTWCLYLDDVKQILAITIINVLVIFAGLKKVWPNFFKF